MVLERIPKLILNGEELKILTVIGEGYRGLTLGLTYKNNPTEYPLFICKIYKDYQDWIDDHLKNYTKMDNFNIAPKLLGVQVAEDNFYNICHINGKKETCIFDKHIYYYEIGGICTLNDYLNLSTMINFENYKLVIKYIDIIVKKVLLLSTKFNIIHTDLTTNNVMIKNNYTIYLFDKFIQYNKIKNNKEFQDKAKDFIKIINNYLLNVNTNKNHSNCALIKNTDKVKLTCDEKEDILIIDWDGLNFIDELIKKYVSNYNKNIKDVNDIFEAIYYTVCYTDILKVLYSCMITLNDIIGKYQINNNIIKVIKYVEDLYKKYVNELYEKSKLYKSIKDEHMRYHLFMIILKGFSAVRTQEEFDKLFKYIKSKKYEESYNYMYNDVKYVRNIIGSVIKN